MKNAKIIFFLTLLSALIIGCKKEEQSKKTREINPPISYPYIDTLNTITYNVAGLPEGLSSSEPLKNTEEIGRRLNAYNLVVVQEDFNYNHLLYKTAKHANKTSWMGPVPIGDGLNLLGEYKISGLKRIKWKRCNGADCLTPKGFFYSQIEIVDGVKIDVYDLHTNAGSDKKDYESRTANILQVFEYIQEHSDGRPILVMGDFNSRYTRAVDTLEIFQQLNLTDTWIEYVRKGIFPTKGAESLMDCTDPLSPNCETVDRIFYRSNEQVKFKLIGYNKARDEFQRDGEDLSDHIPVTSLFEITIMHK
ncbi:MAG: endonuclease/exonuclease/phosphatase family protein [Chitinophagales bacterium]|nr:endonuclease/exonuclease/phosphatase family protein [Chitinophagales bacterium]MCZ2393477.1 endonuclease/exonuclease/phosphatase family protein [Chitinophagales bacterium]